MSSSSCCFLTCIQVSQEADQVVWYSHLFQNFPQFIVIHTVKGFGIVNKAEIDVFLELSCFFYDPTAVVNLISGFSAFSKTSLNIMLNRQPVGICCMTQGAQTRCSVTTYRGGMGWEVEGRFKKEGTCVYLWLIHVDVWQKLAQYCKAIVLLLKINLLKKEKSQTFHWKYSSVGSDGKESANNAGDPGSISG